MTRAFVIRPFDTKEGIDFEYVQAELIDPVLSDLGISGGPVKEIIAAGNIRRDMFEGLVGADIVIADVSIHNANVYYELGIRHALRERMTVLIRAADVPQVPFDLQTDRYLVYDRDDPAQARARLRAAIEQTGASDRPDSPVFALLPTLPPTDLERLKNVPDEFAEDVTRAEREGDRPWLAVLQDEAAGFDWAIPGLRRIGRAQFKLRALVDARITWEAVRDRLPTDPDANLMLATVFQRLDDYPRSFAAIKRVLDDRQASRRDRAEALSLRASNLKTLWCREWRESLDAGAAPAAVALRSPLLAQARETYDEGFAADQNHWYAGINAVALSRVTRLLAERLPDVWTDSFEDDRAAADALRRLAGDEDELAAAVRRSLNAAARLDHRNDDPDIWLELTRADLVFLTSTRAGVVRGRYAEALSRAEAAPGHFAAEAAGRQIRLYRDLGLFEDTAAAALEGLGVPQDQAPQPDSQRSRVLVFAGHRVDAVDRARPRFPRTPEAEQRARRMIADAVALEKAEAEGAVEGIAGGASGGDILFHEVCQEAGIPTDLMLAIPRDDFAAVSVNDAGGSWTERYWRLCSRGDVKVMSDGPELPRWLRGRPGYTVFDRNNRWILHTALSRADTDVTLIVLWDGDGGDGPGGTADMVALARRRGVKVVELDATRL